MGAQGEPATGLRSLPQMQKLLETPQAAALLTRFPRALVTDALRGALAQARSDLLAQGATPSAPSACELLRRADLALTEAGAPVLRRAINATGIVLHTNLGRAPLAPEAVEAMREAAGYANLEFDLDAGVRGSRLAGVAPLLRALSGAEAGLAVNNNAAAVLLALSGLASCGEVIVSRGELVEIGGGFRIPDVIRQSGAHLIEVGTTNKTRLADYEAAITDRTRVVLKVHQSNYRIVGFTAEVDVEELAGLARRRGLVAMVDLGSGAMPGPGWQARHPEPTVREVVGAGADIATFSGDKLLGGPQAGLLVGREAAIAPLRRHPLMRALRLDKVTLAALEATLRLHRDPETAARIPALLMLSQTEDELAARAERLAALLGGVLDARVEATEAYAGGGALPDQALASRGVSVALAGRSAQDLARALRLRRPAVVGRIRDGRLLLDMLTVQDDEVDTIAAALLAASAATS